MLQTKNLKRLALEKICAQLPTYCSRANPIEWACGDVHDLCTRHHTRRRLRDLVTDVVEPFHVKGPRSYNLSEVTQRR
jgi:transposase